MLPQRTREAPTTEKFEATDVRHFPGRTLNHLVDGFTGYKDLRTIRRYAKRDPHVKRYLRLLRSHVLGSSGIQLQTKDKRLIKQWKAWTKVADLSASGNWLDFQMQVLMAYARDGQAMVQPVYIEGEGIRLNLLDTGAINKTRGKNGVKLDKYDRPETYYFLVKGGHTVEVPASEIIKVWDKEEPKQIHGYSPIGFAIDDLKKLREFEVAHTVNATSNALTGGWVKMPPHLTSLPTVGDYDTAAKQVVDAEPGERGIFLEGMDWVPNNAQFPTAGYQAKRRGMLSDIADIFGMSYYSFANDLTGANYSSLRHGWQADIKFYQGIQALLIEFNETVFLLWNLKEEEGLTWTAPGFPYLDPAKEATAQERFVKMGTHAVGELIRTDGRDSEAVLTEREEELEKYPHLRVFQVPETEEENEGETEEERKEREKEEEEDDNAGSKEEEE